MLLKCYGTCNSWPVLSSEQVNWKPYDLYMFSEALELKLEVACIQMFCDNKLCYAIEEVQRDSEVKQIFRFPAGGVRTVHKLFIVTEYPTSNKKKYFH